MFVPSPAYHEVIGGSMAFVVGLTGGIGSGKSTVARIFEVLGIPVYDADSAAKTLMNEHAPLRRAITAAFGDTAYENGRLNRGYLAGIVFNQPEKLKQLNALVHPHTIADAAAWAARQQTPYVVKEAALMFESESFHHTSVVVGVSAPQNLRLQRVMRRDGSGAEEVLKRMARQIPEAVKMKLCDFVIINDEQCLLTPQVVSLHKTLLGLAAAKPNH